MQITPTQILLLLLLLLLCFHFSFINSYSENFKQIKVDNKKKNNDKPVDGRKSPGLIKKIKNLAKKLF